MLVWTQWYGSSSPACLLPFAFLTLLLPSSPFPCRVWLPAASTATTQAEGHRGLQPNSATGGGNGSTPTTSQLTQLPVLLCTHFNSALPITKYCNRVEVKISAGFKLRTLGNVTIFGREIKCLVKKRVRSIFGPVEHETDYTLCSIQIKLGCSCRRWNPHCVKKVKSNLTRMIKAQI